jgi:hypothetical protein
MILHGREEEEVTQRPGEKALCKTAYCHGAGSNCWGTNLASHDKPTAFDIPKLGDKFSG